MVWDNKPDQPLNEIDLAIIGKKSARIDIPLLSRGSLRDIARELHDTSMRLGQLVAGSEVSERSALLEARFLIQQANQQMKLVKEREEITLQDRREEASKVVQIGNAS